MAKTTAGRKLGRKRGHRTQLLRGLASQLLLREQIKTTLPKAKETVRLANHILSVAKKSDLTARRAVARDIQDKAVQKKIFDALVPRYQDRVGGFTRIFRIGRRQGDNAEVALIKLIA